MVAQPGLASFAGDSSGSHPVEESMCSLARLFWVTGTWHHECMGEAMEGQRQPPQVLVLMGVSGVGKTTIGQILSRRLGWDFEEGDSLHPEANVEKMHAGHPLTDEDRWPWLEKVADWIDGWLKQGKNGVITCSALKRSYRNILNRRGSGVMFVHLTGDYATIASRLRNRRSHFMPPSLLSSQFETLEEPQEAEEPVLTVDVNASPNEIADHIIRALDLGR